MSDRVWQVVRVFVVFFLGVVAGWSTWVTMSLHEAQIADVQHEAQINTMSVLSQQNAKLIQELVARVR